MIRILSTVVRRSTRAVRTHTNYTSFNPEAYMRFPQFLHDINSNLTVYQNTQQPGASAIGRLAYTNKCVVVENQAEATVKLLQGDLKTDLNKLGKACRGMFWHSEIDYTVVPCAFKLEGDFTMVKFLQELGLNSETFVASAQLRYCSKGMLPKLPMSNYQQEHSIGSINVFGSPLHDISTVLHKHDEVYHITVGENILNPALQFIVAKTPHNILIGIMSASME